MVLTEVTVAFILIIDNVISLPNLLFDMINDSLLIVNGKDITVIKSLLNVVHFTLPSIIIKSHFQD